MGLKDELLAAAAPPHEDVVVHGVTLRMCGLGVYDQNALAKYIEANGDDLDITLWLIERMAHDTDGNRVFTDDDPALRRLTTQAIEELGEAAARILKEDKAKNFEAVHSPEQSLD